MTRVREVTERHRPIYIPFGLYITFSDRMIIGFHSLRVGQKEVFLRLISNLWCSDRDDILRVNVSELVSKYVSKSVRQEVRQEVNE